MRPIVKTYRRYPSIIDELLNDHIVGGRVEKHCSPATAPVNVKEEEGKYEISLSAPGLSREDLKVTVDKNTLTISYEKPQNDEVEKKYIRKEFDTKSFERSFELPENIELESISAKHENGILLLSIPKKAKVEIPVQKIEVK